MKLFAALLVGLALIPAGCSWKQADPPRPASVPKEALWIGGADGGVFVVASETAGSVDTYQLTIYHASGEVWYRGAAFLRPAGPPKPKIDDPAAYSGWDGEKMILADGRKLEPAEPIKP